MKLLLYCTKAKPILRDYRGKAIYDRFVISPTDRPFTSDDTQPILNLKIVAECDFEVEKIFYSQMFCNYTTWSLGKDEVLNKSCLTYDELKNYLGTKDVIGNDGYNGYAIHIKNLHIFDKPRELSKCHYLTLEKGFLRQIKKAPQNMCYALTTRTDKDILISIQPQWMCKILNGEKTIEVRKKILKEMLNND